MTDCIAKRGGCLYVIGTCETTHFYKGYVVPSRDNLVLCAERLVQKCVTIYETTRIEQIFFCKKASLSGAVQNCQHYQKRTHQSTLFL